MSNAPFLTLISEVLPVQRRDFSLFDPTILNPTVVNPLLDGEWLEIDTNYLAKRGSGEGTKLAFQVFSLKGQYDTQAIGKTTLLFMGGYEAETTLATVGGLTVGDNLVVSDVAVGGQNKRGLIKAAGAGEHLVHGIVTRIIGTTKVRYWHQGVFSLHI
jgi:uncharacterized membrane protein (UPF0136 family)